MPATILQSNELSAQCQGGTLLGTITPTAAWQIKKKVHGGEYLSFNAIAGEIFYFSYCAADGGSVTWDTELSINDNTGIYVSGTYQDDYCGTASYLVWTATTTGTYRILTSYKDPTWGSCQITTTKKGDIAYKKVVPPGVDCSNPVIISSFPYTATSTTCGMINNYGVQCSTTYGGGEDIVYQLNITATGTYNINLTNNDGTNNIGWFLKSSCTGACLASGYVLSGATNNANGSYNFTSTGTYYLIIDTWANSTPTCANFTLNITPVVSGCTLGTGVVNVPSLPYTSGNLSTQNQINDLTGANTTVCGSSSYYTGEDRVFIFTPATSGQITITLTSSGTYTGMMLYDGCPLLNQSGSCVAYLQNTTGDKSLCVPVTAGVTYYLIIDSDSPPVYNPIKVAITAPTGSTTGYTCTTAVTVASLPFTENNKSTACSGNDYSQATSGSCGTAYESGEDYVYKYIATGPECITINLTNTNTYAGFQVYNQCPGDPGAACIGSFGVAGGTSVSGTVTIPASGTYYIMVQSDASGAWNTTYDINIVSNGTGPSNDDPCNATSLTLGNILGGDNGCSGNFNEPATPSCWTAGNVNTVWYSIVAPASGSIKIRANIITLTDPQIALYSGTCGTGLTLVPGACNNDQPACGDNVYKNSELTVTGLTPGQTYYLSVDGYSNLTGTFSVLAIDGTQPFPPAYGQECSVPMPICSQTLTVGNPGYQADGNLCDLDDDVTCLNSGERGSAWYVMNIASNGNLYFNLIPNDYNGTDETDYDFAIWKISGTGTLATCATLFDGTVDPVSCNYSPLGVTGLSATGDMPTSGISPNPSTNYDGAYEPAIPVLAGETYLMNISNFTNSQFGFFLDFLAASPIAYTTAPNTLYWTGGAGDTDWFKPLNWGSCGTIPDSTINAVIGPSSSWQPVIAANNARCKSITINPGASLGINSGYALGIWGNYYNSGTLNANDASTVNMKGNAAQTMDGNMLGVSNFGNLTIYKWGSNNVTLNQNIDIAGTLITTNAASKLNGNAKYIKVGSNVTLVATTFTAGTGGTLEAYYTATPQTITTNANHLYNFTVNKSAAGNLVNLGSTLELDNTITLTLGNLDVTATPFIINIYGGGNWVNIGGDYTYRTGSVNFLGTSNQTILSDNDKFYDVTMNKSGNLKLEDPITLMHHLTLTAGSFDVSMNNFGISIAGNWINNGGIFIPRLGTVKFNGTATQECNKKLAGTVNNADFNFYNVIIDGPDVNFYYDSHNYKINVLGDLQINTGKIMKNVDM